MMEARVFHVESAIELAQFQFVDGTTQSPETHGYFLRSE